MLKSAFLVGAAIAIAVFSTEYASASDNYSCWQNVRANGCDLRSIRSDSKKSDDPAGKVAQTGGRTPNSSKG